MLWVEGHPSWKQEAGSGCDGVSCLSILISFVLETGEHGSSFALYQERLAQGPSGFPPRALPAQPQVHELPMEGIPC